MDPAANGMDPSLATKVDPKQLSHMMRSKLDIYDFLRYQCKYSHLSCP